MSLLSEEGLIDRIVVSCRLGIVLLSILAVPNFRFEFTKLEIGERQHAAPHWVGANRFRQRTSFEEGLSRLPGPFKHSVSPSRIRSGLRSEHRIVQSITDLYSLHTGGESKARELRI